MINYMDIVTEEQLKLYNYIQICKCISMEQAKAFFYNRTETRANHNILNMIKKGMIFLSRKGDYLLASPNQEVDEKTIEANWLFLKYIQNITPENAYIPNGAVLGYIRNHKAYELYVTDTEDELEEAIKNADRNYHRQQVSKEEDIGIIRYVFIVPNIEFIDYINTFVDFPYAYAVANHVINGKVYEQPEFEFYLSDN